MLAKMDALHIVFVGQGFLNIDFINGLANRRIDLEECIFGEGASLKCRANEDRS